MLEILCERIVPIVAGLQASEKEVREGVLGVLMTLIARSEEGAETAVEFEDSVQREARSVVRRLCQGTQGEVWEASLIDSLKTSVSWRVEK